MLKQIIFKIKFHYYNKFINRLVNYLVLLLRNDVIGQNNYDKKTDTHLREIAIEKLFPKISKFITDKDIDNEFLIELTNRINANTHDSIRQIKKEYSLYFSALNDLPDKYFENDDEIKNFYNVVEARQKFESIKIKSLLLLIKKYNREIKKLSKPISERNAVKFQVKFEYFSKALTIGTPIFLIGGIFKQYIISRDFSFSLQTVFSFNDYISASIDTLIFAIIPTLFFTIIFFINFYENSRIDLIRRQRDKWYDIFLYSNYISVFTLTIFTYFKDRLNFYTYLPIAGLLLIFIILPKLFNRYIKHDYNLIILTICILFFYLNIYSDTKSEAYKIKSNKVEKHLEFELTENVNDMENLRYVTSGANYYVFWNAKDSTTVLIKRDIIKKIIIK
jgi:hypothetical protein